MFYFINVLLINVWFCLWLSFPLDHSDIIMKYTADEARMFKSYGELPNDMKINETDIMGGEEGDDGIDVDFDIDEI